MRRVLRWGGAASIALLLSVALAIGLGVVVPRPFFLGNTVAETASRTEAPPRRILILSNPIHTDIAVPADPDVLEAFAFVSDDGLELDYPGVFWIVIGWGGRSFYIETPTWGHLRAGPVIDALTWDDSVMHVRRAGDIPQDLAAVTALELDEAAFQRLTKSILESFSPGPDGVPVSIPGTAYDSHDAFFPARGGFNALLGCNTWTARMLRQAGYRTGVWTPLPATLNWSLVLHNRL